MQRPTMRSTRKVGSYRTHKEREVVIQTWSRGSILRLRSVSHSSRPPRFLRCLFPYVLPLDPRSLYQTPLRRRSLQLYYLLVSLSHSDFPSNRTQFRHIPPVHNYGKVTQAQRLSDTLHGQDIRVHHYSASPTQRTTEMNITQHFSPRLLPDSAPEVRACPH